jgi:hypothetical protein
MHFFPTYFTSKYFQFIRYFAIKTWFLERHDFTYGSSQNNLYMVGHYTQLVWATTHKVGCGFQKCERGGLKGKTYYNYVCNYCPM